VSKSGLAESILRTLRELPQTDRISSERVMRFAQCAAQLPRLQIDRMLRDLRGLTTPELAVLIREARGERDHRTSARSIASAKLLTRSGDLAGRHPELDVALPLAASLLTQGHGSFALDLTHAAAAARIAERAEAPWLLPDPAIQFVRMPARGGVPRFGIAYVRPVAERADADVEFDARLALSMAAYAAVADGVLASRPEALFVLNVVAPGLSAWAPLLRASPAAADAVRAALMDGDWTETPPVALRPVACDYSMSIVSDALKVGHGFWARCVLAGAVPALAPEDEAAAQLTDANAPHVRHLAEQHQLTERVVEGLAARLQVQAAAITALVNSEHLALGAHGMGPARIEVTERLDMEAAAKELVARDVPALEWAAIDWDVDGMRAALEGLGVDVREFARTGEFDPVRMTAALGLDARAFVLRETTVARTQSPGMEADRARFDALADELTANVADVVFEQTQQGRAAADGAQSDAVAQAVRAA